MQREINWENNIMDNEQRQKMNWKLIKKIWKIYNQIMINYNKKYKK